MPEQDEYLYSPVVSQATTATFGVGTNLTWDSYWRDVYNKANELITQQANDLLKRGNIVEAEARALVEGQRNALVLKIRQYNSPFGRLYSEILKPSSKLPTLESLVAQKGSIEARADERRQEPSGGQPLRCSVARRRARKPSCSRSPCRPWSYTRHQRKSVDGSLRVKVEVSASACSAAGAGCGPGAQASRR